MRLRAPLMLSMDIGLGKLRGQIRKEVKEVTAPENSLAP